MNLSLILLLSYPVFLISIAKYNIFKRPLSNGKDEDLNILFQVLNNIGVIYKIQRLIFWRLIIIDFFNLMHLSFIFFYVGLFTVGGGLAALTLMHQELVPTYIDEANFYSFVAVSESTPGSIGVNMSTYIGYNAIGVLGSVCLTLAMVLPSFITILVIARASSNFQDNVIVKRCFYGLRAASSGLIGVAIYKVFVSSILTIDIFKLQRSLAYILNYKAFCFFVVLLILSITILKKLHPVFIIVLSGVFGVLFL